MGRRKISIAPIANDRHRNVTFSKRKSGLIKKATELSVLCDAQVAVLVFSAGHKVTCYSSNPIHHLLQKFSEYTDAPEVHTNADYFRERAQREALEASGQGQRQSGSRVPGSDEEDAAIHASMAAGAGDSAPAIATAVVPSIAGPEGAAMQTAEAVAAGFPHVTAYGAPAMQQFQSVGPDVTAHLPLASATTYTPIAQAQVQTVGQLAQADGAHAYVYMPPEQMAQPMAQPVTGMYQLPTAVAGVGADEPLLKKQRNDADPSMLAAFQATVDDA